MVNSGCYPLGAEYDKLAPYNQEEPPEELFDVCISQTLSKSTAVKTSDYIPNVDIDDGEYQTYNDTSNTNWEEAYKDNHLTPLNLIKQFKSYLMETIPDPSVNKSKFKRFKYLIDECDNWVEDDFVVMEE